ncbi:unnamed protein product [Durusdinium trenchii]|uniref:Uncharacterized protein n=1 Tax=Durusdinium trenchii TaxID=1381693 RepID=A0ABP0PRS4_9DINO
MGPSIPRLDHLHFRGYFPPTSWNTVPPHGTTDISALCLVTTRSPTPTGLAEAGLPHTGSKKKGQVKATLGSVSLERPKGGQATCSWTYDASTHSHGRGKPPRAS